MPGPRPTTTALGAAALLLGGAGWLLGTVPASAHVTVTPDGTSAGSTSVLTFSLGHGCEGSPTTGVAIQLPEGVDAATPTLKPGWDVEKVMAELDQPVTDSHGNQVTERVERVEFRTDTPVPDGYRDTFQVQVTLPEDAAGSTLAFPAVQTCEEGETAWVQVAADGQDPHDLEAPAPTLTVGTAADDEDGSDHGAQGSAGEVEGADASGTTGVAGAGTSGPEPTVAQSATTATGLGVAGLVAGLAGLAAGLTALLRSRRPTP